MRVHSGRVERVRAYTDDCVLDAEGRLVVWLEDVPPGESVALLKELLSDAARSEHMAEEALTALALHAAPEAVQALIDVAKRHASGDVRGGALFWLAQRAGDEARAAITRAIEEDPETEVKRQAVFAVSEMPDGVPLLIDLARRHKNPVVREQAFFWLGESEDPRALAFFEEVLGR
jgi:HEAT repeat protein